MIAVPRPFFTVGVDTQAGLGNAADARDNGSAGLGVFQCDADDALLVIGDDLNALHIAFFQQNVGNRLFQVGSRDVHRRVFGSTGIADAGEQVRDRISNIHATNLLNSL